MPTLTRFDPRDARRQFEERIRSLDADTNRCFCEIEGGPGKAFFPPVFYAFATIDYFSATGLDGIRVIDQEIRRNG
jgi:hypothetical protein